MMSNPVAKPASGPSAHPGARAGAPAATMKSDGTDLFVMGKQACADHRRRHGPRASFVRAKRLLASGAWRGPRDAAVAFVEAADLDALGGNSGARKAGAKVLLSADLATLADGAKAGLALIALLPYAAREDRASRTNRLAALERAAAGGLTVRGVLPSPVGEPQGLDTLMLFARCRLELPSVDHVLADFARLGPRLAQMALGFGADELWGPIVGERALRLGSNSKNPAMTRKEAAILIRGAGLRPAERLAGDTYHEIDEA